MSESIERLGFELSTRNLAEQERALSSLRAGAGTVLAAASVASSFLGARGSAHALDVWAVLALIVFGLCVGSAIWVLLPRDLVLSVRSDALVVVGEAFGAPDVDDIYRASCNWIEPHLERNRRMLAGQASWLTRACALLAIEVLLWTISLIA